MRKPPYVSFKTRKREKVNLLYLLRNNRKNLYLCGNKKHFYIMEDKEQVLINCVSALKENQKEIKRIDEIVCPAFQEKPISATLEDFEKYKANKKSYGSKEGSVTGEIKAGDDKFNNLYFPKNIIEFSNANQNGKEHPTEKPIELLEYLVKTYTNENDMVLDNTMGSGTTNLACLKLNRKSIGIEKEKQYYDVAVRRLSSYCG